MIPVYVISMRRSHERRHSIAARLNALSIPFEFFDAVDGYALTPADMRANRVRFDPHGHDQDPGVVGCYLSHAALYRRIAAEGVRFACVLEDDVELTPDAQIFLQERNLLRLPEFDVLKLSGPRGWRLPITKFQKFSLSAPYRPAVGAFAQIFSSAGMQRVVKNLPPPAMGIDLVLYTYRLIPRLRVLDISPAVARPTNESFRNSTIDTHKPDFIRRLPGGLRGLRRRFLIQWARLRIYRDFIALYGFRALKLLKQ